MVNKTYFSFLLFVLFCFESKGDTVIKEASKLHTAIKDGYFEAVSSPRFSTVSDKYRSKLNELKKLAKAIDKQKSKSRYSQLKEIKLHEYCSQLTDLYYSALSNQGDSVIDCLISSDNAFLAMTKNEQTRKFLLWRIEHCLEVLKKYSFPEFKIPYKNYGEMFGFMLAKFIATVNGLDDEMKAEQLLKIMEHAKYDDVRRIGGNQVPHRDEDYISVRRAGRYPYLRSLHKNNIRYEVYGHTTSSYSGDFVVEEVMLSYKTEFGAEFTTSKLGSESLNVDHDFRGYLDDQVTSMLKMYKKIPTEVTKLDSGADLEKALYNAQKWTRGSKYGRDPGVNVLVEFNYSQKVLVEAVEQITPANIKIVRKSHVASKKLVSEGVKEAPLSKDAASISPKRQELIDKMVVLRKSLCPILSSRDYEKKVSESSIRLFEKTITKKELSIYEGRKRFYENKSNHYSKSASKVGKGGLSDSEIVNRSSYFIFRLTSRHLSDTSIPEDELENILRTHGQL